MSMVADGQRNILKLHIVSESASLSEEANSPQKQIDKVPSLIEAQIN